MSKSEKEHWAYQYGTDKDYLEWLSHQPSCIDGSFNQFEDGEGRSIACHVRRVKNGAGMGIKPHYFAVPMTQPQHDDQHKHGEHLMLCMYDIVFLQEFEAKQWFEDQAEEHLRRWVGI